MVDVKGPFVIARTLFVIALVRVSPLSCSKGPPTRSKGFLKISRCNFRAHSDLSLSDMTIRHWASSLGPGPGPEAGCTLLTKLEARNDRLSRSETEAHLASETRASDDRTGP
jgi:hypothetical protein